VIIHANVLPDESEYKKATKAKFGHFIRIVEKEQDIEKIEDEIGLGQVEEIIQIVEDELRLVKEAKDLKPWEPLKYKAPLDQWKY
jgi:NADH dehydrogenase (ubiquinone) 1 alpha subcomplex subunit 5